MGLVHIYCGDGKGKTTSALGLALRASGSGMRVHIVQFLKGTPTSELNALKRLDNVTVERCDRDYGFTFSMSSEVKAQLTECHNALLRHAIALASSNAIDLLILDEFNVAYDKGLLDTTLADSIVLSKPPHLELVLTGRNPQSRHIQVADYVSEVSAVKHPFQRGIGAREGIEY